jgi:hypothetical protein
MGNTISRRGPIPKSVKLVGAVVMYDRVSVTSRFGRQDGFYILWLNGAVCLCAEKLLFQRVSCLSEMKEEKLHQT